MKYALRLAVLAFGIAASPYVFARTQLVASSPAKDQVLDAPPIEVHLTFNEHVDARHSSVKLVSDKGKYFDADRPHADKADANSIAASVPVLRHGVYRARWTAIAPDGHRMHGDFSFTVK